MTEVLEDNAKKRVVRIPFPLCSTTGFSLPGQVDAGATLPKIVERCRRVS